MLGHVFDLTIFRYNIFSLFVVFLEVSLKRPLQRDVEHVLDRFLNLFLRLLHLNGLNWFNTLNSLNGLYLLRLNVENPLERNGTHRALPGDTPRVQLAGGPEALEHQLLLPADVLVVHQQAHERVRVRHVQL